MDVWNVLTTRIHPLRHEGVTLPVLGLGGTVVVQGRGGAAKLLDLIPREKLTVILAVPTQLQEIAAQPWFVGVEFSSAEDDAGRFGSVAKPNKPAAEEGWFHTGDLARVDDGYFTVVGRLKDMFVSGSRGSKLILDLHSLAGVSRRENRLKSRSLNATARRTRASFPPSSLAPSKRVEHPLQAIRHFPHDGILRARAGSFAERLPGRKAQMSTSLQGRRMFLGALGGALAAGACAKLPKGTGGPAGAMSGSTLPPKDAPLPVGVMPMRTLGRTNEQVSLLGLGGYHLGLPKVEEEDAIRIVRAAADHGVTFFDCSWDYNEGKSEVLLGKGLADGYRKRVFLMTKLDGRTKESVTSQLDESLRRLQTDHLDLAQIHEVIRFSDPGRVFGPDGAIEGLLAAKQAGKIRYIGFTGHKDPEIHLAMLKAAADHGFTFDTVQLPLNVLDPHYKSFEKKVLPELVAKNIGVLGMKTMGDGVILTTNRVSPTECLHYTMSLPTSVVIAGCDSMQVLHQALLATYSFAPLSSQKVEEILARTADVGAGGRFELFKTSDKHDGTDKHPEWLG